ncbi:MAG TPA: GspE/PulE family protein [Pirellulaceae bacterium]|nr:GspE/PulE family protein [Pirellulaceae bacterium]
MTADALAQELRSFDAAQVAYAGEFVERLLAAAAEAGASDVHLHPTPEGIETRWRLDGVLQAVGVFPRGSATDVVARLKVLAGLLTYRTDVPQEGRVGVGQVFNLSKEQQDRLKTCPAVEMRVSTFPTLHGERAVVRLFAPHQQFLYPEDLGFPAEIHAALTRQLAETGGALAVTGPAGCGKTTTAYACLRHLVRRSSGSKSIVSLEDPIEVALTGVSQSQVNVAAGFDLATGLRSLMRQDPEVILVGEIRDRETAAIVFQAALTGHLVLSTFHAGSCATVVSRLTDMGIEPYLLRSGLAGVISQRLVRRLCPQCGPLAPRVAAAEVMDDASRLGLPVKTWHVARGCEACTGTGYLGRLVLAEMLPPLEGELGAAVLDRLDARELARLAIAAGMTPLLSRGIAAVEAGATDPAEIRRVLGFVGANGASER